MSSTTICSNSNLTDNQRGVGLLGGLTIFFLIVLLLIVIFITATIRNFSRQVDENLPAIVSIANQVDDALKTVQVLGPQLKEVLTDYVDGICLPRQDLCPTSLEIVSDPAANFNQCPILCGTLLSSKTVCETLPNNTFCQKIIDPLF